jgi:hypothetical protein
MPTDAQRCPEVPKNRGWSYQWILRLCLGLERYPRRKNGPRREPGCAQKCPRMPRDAHGCSTTISSAHSCAGTAPIRVSCATVLVKPHHGTMFLLGIVFTRWRITQHAVSSPRTVLCFNCSKLTQLSTIAEFAATAGMITSTGLTISTQCVHGNNTSQQTVG